MVRNKTAAIAALLAVLWLGSMSLIVPQCEAKRLTITSEGDTQKYLALSGMVWNNATAVTIPAGADIVSASVCVTGLADEADPESYPESPGLSIGGPWLWRFEGAGYGYLGKQWEFVIPPSDDTISLGPSAPVVLNVLLPAGATVTNASLIIEGNGIMSPRLDAGADGSPDWSASGSFSTGQVARDLAPALNEFLNSRATYYPDAWGNRMTSVPFIFDAGSNGTLRVSGLRVLYEAALPVTNLTAAMNSAVHSGGPGNVTVPLGLFSERRGVLLVSSIDIVYDRAPTVTLGTPLDGSVINSTAAQFFWTGFDADNDPLVYRFSLRGPDGNVTSATLTDPTTIAPGLAPGDYTWWVIPEDGLQNGTCLSGEFRFRVVSPSAEPIVAILQPPDRSVLPPGPVTLRWTQYIPVTGEVSYSVLLDSTDGSSPFFILYGAGNTSLPVPNLPANQTYYWTVVPSVQSGNQTIRGSCSSGVWGFTLGGPPPGGNRPPVVLPPALTVARLGYPYSARLTASDPDGDALTYSLTRFPPGMMIDFGSGQMSWTPVPGQGGNFTVMASVSDGQAATQYQFELSVLEGAPPPPSLRISCPAEGSRANRSVYLMGVTTSAPGAPPVTAVEVRLDQGVWAPASLSGDGWSFLLDTSKSRNGPHRASVRAYDGRSYSEVSGLNLTFDNPRSVLLDYPLRTDGPPGTFIAILAAILVAVPLAILIYLKTKEHGARRKDSAL